MIGIGIDKGDRLVFRSHECSIKDVRGRKREINEVISTTEPDAIISPHAAQLFSEELCKNLECHTEVLLAKDGFEFIFRHPPTHSLIEDPSTYRISADMLERFYTRSHSGQELQSPLFDISSHLNKAGAEAIRWFLMRIHLQPREPKVDPFVLAYNRIEASWTPPEKLPGYRPITGSSPEVAAPIKRGPLSPATKRSK